MKRRNQSDRSRLRGMFVLSLFAAVMSLIALLLPDTSWAVCACTSGRMTSFYPGTAPLAIDGDMSDWDSIMSNPANNICDGPPITDLDAPVQSTGRDLMQFTYTYDSNYVYAITDRVASDSNTDNFIYYADTNNNGKMETGEKVIVVGWQGSNRAVDVYVGTYQAHYAGGDPMVCTTGYTYGNSSCTPGKADGYHLPGTVINMPSPGHPNYSGTWGSADGVQMEWRVTWADLGLGASPGQAFTFHVSSTNSQPGAGSFPAQVDDNMGGCGGGGGSSQYAGATLVPDRVIPLTTATTYTATHTLTNTGNGNDNYTLTYAVSGPNNPTITSVTYLYNGTPFTDTSALGANFSLAPGTGITFTIQYTFSGSPQGKGPYYVTTTARSKFDTGISSSAVDTLTSKNVITIRKQTNGGYGSFSFSGGTNGLPASLSLTTTAGNNPDTSQGYVPSNTNQTSSITETVQSGWRFNSGTCAYVTTGTAVAGVNFTSTPPTVTMTVPANIYTDSINCTFINEKLPTISATKLLGAPRVSDSDQFTIQLKNSGGTLLAGSATTGTGETVTAGTGYISYTATGTGVAYYLDEIKSAGPTPATVYAASVSCTNNGAAVLLPNALGAGQSFTPGIGDNYACFITNSPPVLTVRKQSSGGTGVFSFAGTNGVSGGFTLDTTTANPQSASFVLSAISTQTTVTETVPAGWTLTGASCVDGSNNPVAGTILVNGTLTVPAAAIAAGANLTCTFTNSRLPTVQVAKNSTNSTGTFTFAGSNGMAANFNLATITAGTPVAGTVYTVTSMSADMTITETPPSGWPVNPASASCVDSNAAISGNPLPPTIFGGLSNNVLTIPAANLKPGSQILCTFTNTLPAPTVQLKKTSTNSLGTFTFDLTNLSTTSDSITTAVAGTPVNGAVNSVASTSTNVTVTETAPAGWPANPVSASCTDANGTISGNGAGTFGSLAGNVLTILPANLKVGAQIVCSIINTKPTVQVAKNSTNGTGTFSYALTNLTTASDSITTAVAGTPVNGIANNIVTSAGTAVTISETAPVGWPANPASASCTDTNGAASGNGAGTFGTLTGNVLTIPAANLLPAAQILCTFTNTLSVPTVQVQKTSNNGTGTFTYALTNMAAGSDSITTAVAGTPVNGTTNGVTSTSSTVTVTETVPAGWPANPVSASCTDTNGTASGNGAGSFGTLAGNVLTIPTANLKPGAQILCSFVNTAFATITVNKTLLPASDSGKFNLLVEATTVATNVGDNGTGTATVPANAAVTVSETAGTSTSLANYTTTYSCTGGITGSGTSVTFTPTPGQIITCTFTNSRLATVTIAKRSNGGTGSFAFSGGTNGLPASLTLDTGIGNPKISTVYAVTALNTTAAITETVPAGWALNAAATICTDGAATFGTLAGGTLTIPAGNVTAGKNITCTFTNDKNATITVNKTLLPASDGGTFNLLVGATTVAASIGDAGTGTTTVPANVAVTISETASTGTNLASYATTYSCTNGSVGSGTSVSITPAPDQAITCTFTNNRNGFAVSGTIYGDANHNGTMDGGETGTGLSISVKLATRNGSTCANPAIASAAADPATGAYTLPTVNSGDYCLILDNNSTVGDTTPTYPNGWLGTEISTGIRSITVSGGALASQNFGMYNGSRLSGRVFSDTGAGGGTPNNGVQDGAETGLAGVTVRVADNTITYDSIVTNGSGDYALWIPAAAGNNTLKVVETNPGSYVSTGGNAGTTGGSYARGIDTVTFTNTMGSSFTGVNFADVPANAFVSSNSRSIVAGGVAFYPHTFTAGTGGTVTFTTGAVATPAISGWSEVLYLDSNCNGSLDGGEPQIAGPGPIVTTAGQQVCILVKEFAPANAPANATNLVTVGAGFDYSNASPSLAVTLTVTDLTTVAQSGLTLLKFVDKASAIPGDTLIYTITYVNTGSSQLSNIVINDNLPAFTNSPSACCVNPSVACMGTPPTSYPASITGCTVITTSSSVTWSLSGTLSPGASGQVKLNVKIDQ